MGHERFSELIRRLGRARSRLPERPSFDTAPGCPFGAVVEERLKELDRGLGEVKSRVNGLIFLVVGAVLAEVILRLIVG